MKITKALLLIMTMGATQAAYGYGPDPDEVYINNIVHAGTGCPIGSVAADISEDGKAFTLLFDEYVVEAGPGISKRESRKFCQVTLNMHVPQGWSYTVMNVDYAGYASLDPKTKGIQTSTYYFQGQRKKAKLTTVLKGKRYGFDDDYEISDKLGLSALVWSPCGVNRALNIKTALQVRARGNKSALMTTDSIDGELMHKYGIKWKKCY